MVASAHHQDIQLISAVALHQKISWRLVVEPCANLDPTSPEQVESVSTVPGIRRRAGSLTILCIFRKHVQEPSGVPDRFRHDKPIKVSFQGISLRYCSRRGVRAAGICACHRQGWRAFYSLCECSMARCQLLPGQVFTLVEGNGPLSWSHQRTKRVFPSRVYSRGCTLWW